MIRAHLRQALVAIGALGALACTESLTTPGHCPGTCPGGTIEVKDTTLSVVLNRDSAYSGYVLAGSGQGLLVSTDEPANEVLTGLRFGWRPDSVRIGDTTYAYTIDSVAFSIGVTSRDPAALGIALQLYRAPATLDSSVTFADLDSMAAPAAFLDSIRVPDTLQTGNVRVVLSGPDLAKVAIPPGDSGVIALVVGLTAATPTGVVIGSATTGTFLPQFITYISVAAVDSTRQPNPIVRVPDFDTYAEASPPAPPADQLLLGSAPSSRILLRFDLDHDWLIGRELLRAELLLTPAAAIPGVPGISSTAIVRNVLSDQGAKSPLVPLVAASTGLTVGSTDTVGVEVLDLVRTWQTVLDPPAQAFFVSLSPEAASFTTPAFNSSRSPAGGALLRITYVTSLDFETP